MIGNVLYNIKSEVGSRKSEVGSRKSEVGSRKSEVGSRKSGIGCWGLAGIPGDVVAGGETFDIEEMDDRYILLDHIVYNSTGLRGRHFGFSDHTGLQ